MAESSSSSDEDIIKISLVLALRRRKERNRRRWWTRPRLEMRREQGAYHCLMKEIMEDQEGLNNFVRMDIEHFQQLLMLMNPLLQKQDTNMRECIPPGERLAVTLRFLASGDSYKSLHDLYKIGSSTLGSIIPSTCRAIVQVLKDKYLKVPNTTEEWESVAAAFHNKWNFPHCIGAIDGKHIPIKVPPNRGSAFNYKDFRSVILLAVVDAHYRFLWYQLGDNGRQDDAGIYNSSVMAEALTNNTLNFPEPSKVRERGTEEVPYLLVGDDAFPLKTHLMKPYPSTGLNDGQKIFNYRLGRARRVAENAFGILVNRFRVLAHGMNLQPSVATDVTEACLALHNFLWTEQDVRYSDQDKDTQTVNWQGERPVWYTGNSSAGKAWQVREELQTFFWKEGQVPFQWAHIDGGHQPL